MPTTIPGQCLCGRITFSAEPASHKMDACHCLQCRKWSGGVLFAVVCSSLQINNEPELTAYQSSDWGERLFWSPLRQQFILAHAGPFYCGGDAPGL